MAAPTIPQPSEAMNEIVAKLDRVQSMRVELGATLPEFAAEEIEEARASLRLAMRLLDCDEYRDLHIRIANEIRDLEDSMAMCRERGRS